MTILNNYYTVPIIVLRDKNLSKGAKLLFIEIYNTSDRDNNGDYEDYCSKRNKYLAELLNVSSSSIKLWLRQLKNSNFIKIELIYEENSKELIERRIIINNGGI